MDNAPDTSTDTSQSASMKSTLTKKYGPFPGYVYAIILGVGVAFLYIRHKNSTATSATTTLPPTSTVLPTTPVDTSGTTTDSSGGTTSTNGTSLPSFIDPAWLGSLIASLDSSLHSSSSQSGTQPGNSNPPSQPGGTSISTPTGGTSTPQNPINIPVPTSAGLMDLIHNIAPNEGIPQVALNQGQFNVVRVPEGISTADLQGWTAWAWNPNGQSPNWTEFTGGIIPAGVYGVAPTGTNPNSTLQSPQGAGSFTTDFSRVR